jgi:hypothetical protein
MQESRINNFNLVTILVTLKMGMCESDFKKSVERMLEKAS